MFLGWLKNTVKQIIYKFLHKKSSPEIEHITTYYTSTYIFGLGISLYYKYEVPIDLWQKFM